METTVIETRNIRCVAVFSAAFKPQLIKKSEATGINEVITEAITGIDENCRYAIKHFNESLSPSFAIISLRLNRMGNEDVSIVVDNKFIFYGMTMLLKPLVNYISPTYIGFTPEEIRKISHRIKLVNVGRTILNQFESTKLINEMIARLELSIFNQEKNNG